MCLRFYHYYVHRWMFHPLLTRSLYLLRFYHIIFYTGCGTFKKKVCHNTRTLLSYLHFYARTEKVTGTPRPDRDSNSQHQW
jgi:hypothetical protein